MSVLEAIVTIENAREHENFTKFSALEYASLGDHSKRATVAFIKEMPQEQLLKEIDFHKKVVEYLEFSLLNSRSYDVVEATKRTKKLFLRAKDAHLEYLKKQNTDSSSGDDDLTSRGSNVRKRIRKRDVDGSSSTSAGSSSSSAELEITVNSIQHNDDSDCGDDIFGLFA